MDLKCEALLDESTEEHRHQRPVLITAASCGQHAAAGRAVARRDATVILEQVCRSRHSTLVPLQCVDSLGQAEDGWRWRRVHKSFLNDKKVVAKAGGSKNSSVTSLWVLPLIRCRQLAALLVLRTAPAFFKSSSVYK